MSNDLDVYDVMRVIAFIAGLFLLISGFGDLGSIGVADAVHILSLSGTAILELIFGVFLMMAGINPDSVAMIINVIINR